jgi:hypothetical protein
MRASCESAAPLLLPTACDIFLPTLRRIVVSLFWLALLGLAVMVPACGRSGHVPVCAVRGQVTFQGRPTPNAFIALHPLGNSGKDVPHPTAYADAEGRFSLSTYGSEDGAPVGEYAVTVVWWASPQFKDAQEGDDIAALNRLPARYADPKSSGLHARIAESNDELTLRLAR